MRRILLAALALIFPSIGFATELAPWFGTNFQFDTRLDYLYQYYRTFQTHCGPQKMVANDSFIHGSISTTILGEWFVEAEGTIAFTHKQRHDLDNLRLTGRHLILDDVVGDPVSLAIGVTFTQAFNHSVNDPSSFHHGKWGGELHVSIGKETSCGALWVDRKWALIALGQADQGSPWGRAQLHWERNQCDLFQTFVFADFLWGFGQKQLCYSWQLKKFHGYGLIRHRSLDLGGGIKKKWGSYLDIGLRFAYRLAAKNFPKSAFRGLLTLQYPFSL